ncbi:MAG: HD domain-containing protein [Promethearchaeota archaeon]
MLKIFMQEIEKFARENMVQDFLHGWSHIERVLKYASIINRGVNANWDIIKSAILLHDIGYGKDREKHHEISAVLAEEFLLTKEIDQDIISNIKHCIISHSRQFAKEKPLSKEAQVVFDADGMDLFGPIGLMRALLSCTLRNQEFECILKKLEWRLQECKNFYNKESKIFVAENSTIIKTYLFRLKKQLEFFKGL